MIADTTTIQLLEIFEDFNKNNSNGDTERLSNTEVTAIVDRINSVIQTQSYIGKVKNFMLTFKQPVHTKPAQSKQVALRLSLLLEELGELAIASGTEGIQSFQELLKKQVDKFNTIPQVQDENLVEVFDALIDLQYVLSGAKVSWGMDGKFDAGFDEVHSSNMSKVCESSTVCAATVEKYNGENVETVTEHLGDDKWLVMRQDDGKVLKSIKYSPAKLAPILNLD